MDLDETLREKLQEVLDDEEFILNIFCHLEKDEDVQYFIDYIDTYPDVTSETLLLIAIDASRGELPI